MKRHFLFMYEKIQSNKVMGMEINNIDNNIIILPKKNKVTYSTSLNNVTIVFNVVGHFLSHRALLGCTGRYIIVSASPHNYKFYLYMTAFQRFEASNWSDWWFKPWASTGGGRDGGDMSPHIWNWRGLSPPPPHFFIYARH